MEETTGHGQQWVFTPSYLWNTLLRARFLFTSFYGDAYCYSELVRDWSYGPLWNPEGLLSEVAPTSIRTCATHQWRLFSLDKWKFPMIRWAESEAVIPRGSGWIVLGTVWEDVQHSETMAKGSHGKTLDSMCLCPLHFFAYPYIRDTTYSRMTLVLVVLGRHLAAAHIEI